MMRAIPGQSDAAYLIFAVLTALIERLEAKNVLSKSDVSLIFDAADGALRAANDRMATQAADFLRDRFLSKK